MLTIDLKTDLAKFVLTYIPKNKRFVTELSDLKANGFDVSIFQEHIVLIGKTTKELFTFSSELINNDNELLAWKYTNKNGYKLDIIND